MRKRLIRLAAVAPVGIVILALAGSSGAAPAPRLAELPVPAPPPSAQQTPTLGVEIGFEVGVTPSQGPVSFTCGTSILVPAPIFSGIDCDAEPNVDPPDATTLGYAVSAGRAGGLLAYSCSGEITIPLGTPGTPDCGVSSASASIPSVRKVVAPSLSAAPKAVPMVRSAASRPKPAAALRGGVTGARVIRGR